MNIQFLIMAHGFEKAAAIEKALKEIGVPYESSVAKSVANKTPRTRVIVTKEMLMVVEQNLSRHEDWSDLAIAKESGVSSATVGRIRKGTHALQQNGAAKT